VDEGKKVRDSIQHNEFTRVFDIEIIENSIEYARGKMRIESKHINRIGSVHGGAIFSLADTIGGCAAASNGTAAATISGNINYLSPAINTKEIIAVARIIKSGKNILVYNIDLFDEKEKLLATATFTYFAINKLKV